MASTASSTGRPTRPIRGRVEPDAPCLRELGVRGTETSVRRFRFTGHAGTGTDRIGGRPVTESEALAFWVREPGVGEIRPVARPRSRSRTRCSCGRCASGVSRGTETLVFRGGGPGEPVRRDAGAVPGGRLPGTGEVRLPQRRCRRAAARPTCVGRTVFCLHPHQTAYVVPADAVTVVPDGVPAGAGGARRDRGDGRQRALGRRDRCSVTGSRWSAAGMVGCCVARLLARIPGVEVTLVDVDPSRADGRRRARRRLRAARRRPGRARPGRAHQRHLRRAPAVAATCSRRRAPCSTSAGTATGGARSSLGGAFHSGRLTIRASQVGRVASRAAGVVRPASGWRSRSSCCATRPSTRC